MVLVRKAKLNRAEDRIRQLELENQLLQDKVELLRDKLLEQKRQAQSRSE